MLTPDRFPHLSSTGPFAKQGEQRLTPSHSPNDHQLALAGHNSTLAEKILLASSKPFFLGYPINMNTPPEEFFSWRRQLNQAGIGVDPYNNLGNPDLSSPIGYNTHEFEKEIILSFSKHFGFLAEDCWGFVSNSGTDSNLHGLYMGRTILTGRCGVAPKCYFTEDAHYSIQILCDLLGLKRVLVEALADGSMDADNLAERLKENPNQPALVVATTGTTFKGAIDPLDRIHEILKAKASYVHLDAALFGGYLPYTEHGADLVLRSNKMAPSPRFDSISISCHKFFGFPSPAGLFMTTQDHFGEFNQHYSQIHRPEYIGQVPGTITCSRDAVKPAEFYFFSRPAAIARQIKDAYKILSLCDQLMEQMQSQYAHWGPKRASPVSNIVYFKKPNDRIVKKYALATMELTIERQKQKYAHVVIMPHASSAVLDEFLSDLENDHAG